MSRNKKCVECGRIIPKGCVEDVCCTCVAKAQKPSKKVVSIIKKII